MLGVHAAMGVGKAPDELPLYVPRDYDERVRAAVTESLPQGVGLQSLGAWRFHGLPQPVDLFQVTAADLIADFPPPRSADPAK